MRRFQMLPEACNASNPTLSTSRKNANAELFIKQYNPITISSRSRSCSIHEHSHACPSPDLVRLTRTRVERENSRFASPRLTGKTRAGARTTTEEAAADEPEERANYWTHRVHSVLSHSTGKQDERHSRKPSKKRLRETLECLGAAYRAPSRSSSIIGGWTGMGLTQGA